PCVSEMPLLRDITRAFRKTEPELRFAYVSETLEEERLLDFLRRHARTLPDADVYQSTDGRLRALLQTGKQPITLLLDRQMVVRHAFVGTVGERRNELVDAIERLLRTLRQR